MSEMRDALNDCCKMYIRHLSTACEAAAHKAPTACKSHIVYIMHMTQSIHITHTMHTIYAQTYTSHTAYCVR